MRFLILTPPGLETLAADEVAELAPGQSAAPAGSDLPGRLRVEASGSLEWRRLRLASRVAREAGEVAAASVDELRSSLQSLEFPELETARSFRVTAHAAPGATLDPQEAARAAGGVFHLRHGTPVDLRGYDLEIRLDLGRERALVSAELHRDPLDRRMKRAKNLRSALKPTVAAGLVRFAGAQRGAGSLLDPTCGSGTIAVEAKSANPALDVFASDWDEPTSEVARGTVANHGLEIEVRHADARELRPAWRRRFERIVFNPPYGVQVGRGARIAPLYCAILASAVEVLEPGGRIVMLTPRRKALEEAARRAGVRVEAELPLSAGQLRPVAFLLSGA